MNLRLALSLVLGVLIGYHGTVSAQDSTPELKFAASLTDYTAEKPVFVNDIPEDEEDLEGVNSVSIRRFKSKSPVSTNPDTYATLALIILEYKDDDTAKAALDKVPKGAKEEMRKSPELNIVSGDWLYRLVGTCLLSEEDWRAVERKLIEAVVGYSKAPDNWVRIACGGNVSVSGEH